MTEPTLTPGEKQAIFDRTEQALREALSMIVDHLGMGFQDRPWWLEAHALKRAMENKTQYGVAFDWDCLNPNPHPCSLSKTRFGSYDEAVRFGESETRGSEEFGFVVVEVLS